MKESILGGKKKRRAKNKKIKVKSPDNYIQIERGSSFESVSWFCNRRRGK